MDILSLLLQHIFRAIVVVLPLTVGWLAFRRLVLSRSANAWIYATVCLFAAVTSASLIPWTLSLGSGNWLIFLFSAISPAVWMTVIMICDANHHRTNYELGPEEPDVTLVAAKKSTAAPEFHKSLRPGRPLILEEPNWPEAPVAVFRHLAQPANIRKAPRKRDDTTESVLSIARSMRGNSDSNARRPSMLPSPDHFDDTLPFVSGG